MNNARCETSRTFRNEKTEYLNKRIDKLEINRTKISEA
jgi:hypothetical protein